MIRVVQEIEWPNGVILESFDDIKNAESSTFLSGWLPRRWAVRHLDYYSRLLLIRTIYFYAQFHS